MGDETWAELIIAVNEDGTPIGGSSGAAFAGLTNTELRAASVAVVLDASTLAALETVQIGSLPAVSLDATTLTALENTTTDISDRSGRVLGIVSTDLTRAEDSASASGDSGLVILLCDMMLIHLLLEQTEIIQLFIQIMLVE